MHINQYQQVEKDLSPIVAAHCVTDKKGNKKEKEQFRVAAGKYYRTYDHPNDTDAEFSEVL